MGRTEKATRKSGRENIELWNIYRRLIERNKLLYFCAVTHGRISDDRLSGEVISKGCCGASAAREHINCKQQHAGRCSSLFQADYTHNKIGLGYKLQWEVSLKWMLMQRCAVEETPLIKETMTL